MKQTKTLKFGMAILLTAAGVVSSGVVQTANAQSSGGAKSSNPSNQGGRDPFRKYEPPRLIIKKSNVLPVPSIQERIAQYKAQKLAAMNARVAAPKPTTAFLLSEMQVVGISRSPRGYAAIVEGDTDQIGLRDLPRRAILRWPAGGYRRWSPCVPT